MSNKVLGAVSVFKNTIDFLSKLKLIIVVVFENIVSLNYSGCWNRPNPPLWRQISLHHLSLCFPVL